MYLGELLPKTAALRYPEKLAMLTLPPMTISQWVFRPLVAIFNGSAFRLMKLWGLAVAGEAGVARVRTFFPSPTRHIRKNKVGAVIGAQSLGTIAAATLEHPNIVQVFDVSDVFKGKVAADAGYH